MAQKRTKQDLYALITPNFGVGQVEDGDEVEILHRGERLESIGWIHSFEQENGEVTAELTELGAAIVNYGIMMKEQGTLHEQLDESVGTFVSNAKDRFIKEASWDLVSRQEEVVVMENHLGEIRVYELHETDRETAELIEEGVLKKEHLEQYTDQDETLEDPDELAA